MSQWSIKVEKLKEVVFEVVQTNSDWDQFARIEASPDREYRLGAAGSKVRVGCNSGDSIVSFVPYSKDENGKVRVSVFNCFSDTKTPRTWTIQTEAGDKVDFDDYIVRVSVVDAPKETVEALETTLQALDYDIPSTTYGDTST